MKKDRKSELKERIEKTEKELERLKVANPDGNYEDVEEFLRNLNRVLEDDDFRYPSRLFIAKIFILFFLSYLLCTITVSIVFGFTHSMLNPIPPMQFLMVVPLTSLVLFLVLRSLNYVSNKMNIQHPLFFIIVSYVIIIIVFAFLDNLYFHICSSLDKSLLMSSLLMIIVTMVDMAYTKKIYF